MVNCERRWGQWRVFYVNDEGELAYLPASWTDVGLRDPFVEQAAGRAIARWEDLKGLVTMAGNSVKENPPQS